MSLTRIPVSAPNLTVYADEQGGLVFHQTHHTLQSLTPLGMVCLLALDSAESKEAALKEAHTHTGLDANTLSDVFASISTLFNESKPTCTYQQGRYPELDEPVPNSAVYESVLTVNIAEHYFSVSCENNAFIEALTELLAPITSQYHSSAVHVKIVEDRDGFSLWANNLKVEQQLTYDQLMPVLIDRLQVYAFQLSDYQFCFHGAALRTPGGDVILPGQSGAGKSTLCALLASKGCAVYSDEMVALNNDSDILTIKLPIAIKSGSWEFLSEQYNELSQKPTWKRVDGRQLKYIWPHAFADGSFQKSGPIGSVTCICPQYSQEHVQSVATTPITVTELLTEMTQSGYQVGFELDALRLEALLNYLNNAIRYKSIYNDASALCAELASQW